MPRTVTGPIELPDGTAVTSATIKFYTTRNSYSADGSVPIYTEMTTTTDVHGAMSVALNYGQYRVLLQASGETNWLTLGDVLVEAGGTVPIGEILEFTDSDLVTTFPDAATQTWVESTYTAGTASSIDITDLGLGAATAYEAIEINASGNVPIGTRRLGQSLCFGGA